MTRQMERLYLQLLSGDEKVPATTVSGPT